MGLGLEIFEDSFPEGFWSDSWAWAWKFLKIIPESFLESLLGLGLEILENRFLEIFWIDFLAWAWNCLKIVPWKPSGATFRPGPGHA